MIWIIYMFWETLIKLYIRRIASETICLLEKKSTNNTTGMENQPNKSEIQTKNIFIYFFVGVPRCVSPSNRLKV